MFSRSVRSVSCQSQRSFSTSASSSSSSIDLYSNVIGGETKEGFNVESVHTVLNKYTQEPMANVELTGQQGVDMALEIAHNAHDELRLMPTYQKRDILLHVAAQLDARKTEFAEVISQESGKAIRDALGEVDRAFDTFTIAAEEVQRMNGEWVNFDIRDKYDGYTGIIKRASLGPSVLITPFNFPLNLVAHKVAPAIMSGSPFILKPAVKTPVSAMLLSEVLMETNLPFSTINVDDSLVVPMVADPKVKVVSFTGSTQVGWMLKQKANVKAKVALELGGIASCVIDNDVDLDIAAGRVAAGAFGCAGQSCISVQRVHVHQDVFDSFADKLVQETENNWKLGDPMDSNTAVGCVISAESAERIQDDISGATILTGGHRDGHIMEPTIVTDVSDSSPLHNTEMFGPIVLLEKFDDFRAVCDRVNNTTFGLQAGVFTNNINKAHYAFDIIEAGGVVINDIPTMRIDAQPYGGSKDSGVGREGLRFAIEDFTELKTMLMKKRDF